MDFYLFLLFVTMGKQALQWIPKTSPEERETLEAQTREYLDERTDLLGEGFEYGGFRVVEDGKLSHYPIHYVQPLNENTSQFIDFDLFSVKTQREAIEKAVVSGNVSVSRVCSHLYNETCGQNDTAISLFHPGISLGKSSNMTREDVAAVVLTLEDLVLRASAKLEQSMAFYLYDTDERDDVDAVLAAELLLPDNNSEEVKLRYLDSQTFKQVGSLVVFTYNETIRLTGSTVWRVAMVALDDTFQPNVQPIILAGKFILMACLCIGLWIYTSMKRTKTLTELKRRNDLEKAAMIVQSARESAKVEQELNDYIAHEVRNPLAAAMSACSFVKAAVNETKPLQAADDVTSVREDVDIIDNSLSFMNDLLRSMLDMHRAKSKKIEVKMVPVDVMHDVLQPVATMLYKRDMTFDVVTECTPNNLLVMTDRLRLKQIILNLGRNATKFVREGYVKLGAAVVDGNVRLYVEDTGFGISKKKRKSLFAKFQESLDLMNQGTGMGLCLCKHMTELLTGDIWLDETYKSGLEDYPGTRFIVDLKMPPIATDQYESFLTEAPEEKAKHAVQTEEKSIAVCVPEAVTGRKDPLASTDTQTTDMSGSVRSSTTPSNDKSTVDNHKPSIPKAPTPRVNQSLQQQTENEEVLTELPETLSILFVDDDLVLRKLFARSVRKVVSTWNIKEASSGETAIRMCEDEKFDLIFLDQYMASVEKQLLGTETARALRSKGIFCRICGLSANDVEQGFIRAGADFFMFKPFPCQPRELRKQLHHILFSRRINENWDRLAFEAQQSAKTPVDPQPLSESPVEKANTDSVTSQVTQSTFADESKDFSR